MTTSSIKLLTMQEVRCPVCDKAIPRVNPFVDQVSFREWMISGLCQACQDEIFEGEVELEDIP